MLFFVKRIGVMAVTVSFALGLGGFALENARADDKGGPRIKVKKPNGGEIWVRGEKQKLRWKSIDFNGFNVRVELLNNGTLDTVINDITANDGKVNWVVPNDIDVDSDYQIRVISIASPDINDTSDEDFAIVGL